MSDFWELSTGEEVQSTTSFEMEGGNLDPIPNNTSLVAVIDEAKIDTDREGNKFVSLRWSALQPVEYKNRKVFQKLWVFSTHPDPRAKDPAKKRDTALKMLSAIDANTGGKLKAAGRAPTDESLGAFTNKPMIILTKIWEMKNDKGDKSSGNWIASVSPKVGKVDVPAAAPKKAKPVDDDIPF